MQPLPGPLDAIIEMIEHVRTRIGMYIRPADVPNTESFLTGLRVALTLCGVQHDTRTEAQVREVRGWWDSSVGPLPQMEDRGMTTEQMIDELIQIEIEVLRRCNPA